MLDRVSLALIAAASSNALARCDLWLKIAVAEAVKAWVRAVWSMRGRREKGNTKDVFGRIDEREYKSVKGCDKKVLGFERM